MIANSPKNLYEIFSSRDHLLEIWEREALTSEARGRDGQSPAQFMVSATSHAGAISAAMADGSYRFIAYRQFLKSRGATRLPRVISVPASRDRAPLKALLKFLHETSPSSKSELPQVKIKRVMRTISENRYKHFVRIDVKNFYPSIAHTAVDEAIDKHVSVPAVQKLLKEATRTGTVASDGKGSDVRNDCGVPQGLPISNALAEMVMADIDKKFSEKQSIAYFRYVDDILILTTKMCHRKIFKEISELLIKKGLECHELRADASKSTWGTLSAPLDFLGYSLSSSCISVRNGSILRLKSKIALLFIKHEKTLRNPPSASDPSAWESDCLKRLEWYLNITISGCTLDGRRRGWIHYFSLINDFSLIRSLDHFVARKLYSHGLSSKIAVNSFITSYRRAASSSSDHTGIIKDFDSYSLEEQKHVLQLIFKIPERQLAKMEDAHVTARFFQLLRKELDTLEIDLSLVY